MKDNYTRPVVVRDVHDGDTFRAEVDLGFYVQAVQLCRVVGINAPELNEPGGIQARDHLKRLLAVGPTVVQSVAVDKYAGRFDAHVTSGGVDVAADLVKHGLAVVWDGSGPKPSVPWPPPRSTHPTTKESS